jgi:2-polyprenyl-3-methyl-5-hydroxy-6-metoxy-1,4-benzoquinol methylase
MICKICNNSEDNRAYQIREMMFGFRDEFIYFECSRCGCLQLAEIPKDIEKYYPRNYYSFQQEASHKFIEQFVMTRRDRYVLFNSGFLGGLLYRMPRIVRLLLRGSPNRRFPDEFDAVFRAIAWAGVSSESRILDVGCGSGGLLHSLRDVGLKNLVGVDPYISDEVSEGELRILKKTIHDLPNSHKFDLILFIHSLEHIPDQLGTLMKAYTMLAEDGVCLIRMPFIHTMRSFDRLTKEAGLAIVDVVFDSWEFQFFGSEQYKMDIPLEAKNSYAVNPGNSMFTPQQIRQFRESAKELNKINQGDQAAFYLKRDAN